MFASHWFNLGRLWRAMVEAAAFHRMAGGTLGGSDLPAGKATSAFVSSSKVTWKGCAGAGISSDKEIAC